MIFQRDRSKVIENGGIQNQVGHDQDEKVDQRTEGEVDDDDDDAIGDDDVSNGDSDYEHVYDDPQETGSNMGSELEKDARSFLGGFQSHHCWSSEKSMSLSIS